MLMNSDYDTHTHTHTRTRTCTHGIFLGYKKEWNFATCNNMDGAENYYAQ